MMRRLIILILALPTLVSGMQGVSPEEPMSEQTILIDFRDADLDRWSLINDGVMGGVSRSDIRRTDRETGLFTGVLSLENNGGFASARAVVGRHDLSAADGLEVRVRGDGRTYQLRLREDDRYDGVSHRALFETRDGEWTTVQLPFALFLPTFRGRILNDSSTLDPSRIRQVAFMLADKTPGPFTLEIEFVRTWSTTP